MSRETDAEISAWKDAVWDYLLEHCDITDSGALFVKFHTSGRISFEKHVRARMVHNYHREDPRKKEELHLQKQVAHKEEKTAKKMKYKEDKKARLEAQALIKREMKKVERRNKMRRLARSVWTFVITPFKKMLHL